MPGLWPGAWGIGNGEAPRLGDGMADEPNQLSPDRAGRIAAALTAAFAPVVARVTDDSAHHAGHAGAGADGQTHYTVLLVSTAFQGMSRVARSRAVHEALASEFGPVEAGGMHALALTLRTPEEHEVLLARGG